MPVLPPAPRTIKMRFSGTIDSDVWASHLFLTYVTGATVPTNGDLDALASDTATQWVFHRLYGNTRLTAITIEDLSSPSSAVGSWAGVDMGLGGTAKVGVQVATLIKAIISRRYRGGHPRLYYPPMEQGDMQDSRTWTAAGVAAMQSDWDTFTAAIGNATWPGTGLLNLSNVSYYSGHALRIAPVIDGITGMTVEPVIATQRRRVGR